MLGVSFAVTYLLCSYYGLFFALLLLSCGGWFAGLSWANQGLASNDLSSVMLMANIRGQTESGGGLGEYELRIEDAEGDRLFFCGTATGGWQSVGGPLSSATEGAALSGGYSHQFGTVNFAPELFGGVMTTSWGAA